MHLIQSIAAAYKSVTQFRTAATKQAELDLMKAQHRAEVFALEQSLHTAESERDGLKLQIAAIQADLDRKEKAIKEADAEIWRLNHNLSLRNEMDAEGESPQDRYSP